MLSNPIELLLMLGYDGFDSRRRLPRPAGVKLDDWMLVLEFYWIEPTYFFS